MDEQRQGEGAAQTDLEAQFEAALIEHARQTGGLMVGDTVTVAGYTIRITGYDGGNLECELEQGVTPQIGETPAWEAS